jgi:hypothetical protein
MTGLGQHTEPIDRSLPGRNGATGFTARTDHG